MSEPSQAVLFDLATLGVVRRAPSPGGFEGLDVYPHVHAVLEQLRADGVRLGVTTAREDATEQQVQQLLQQSGLSSPVDLVVVGSDRFARAVQAMSDTATCVFVGEDRDERSAAREAGLRVAPHARFAAAALRGERLRYVRVTVPVEHAGDDWRQAVAGLDVVPLRVDGDQGTVVDAIATSAAATQLDDLGFEVFRLGGDDEPLTTEVYLLRDDRQTRTGFLVPEGASRAQFSADDESSRILASTRQGLYVALRAGRSVEGYHFEEARHGHTEKLLPDLSLLQSFEEAPARMAPAAEEPPLSEDEQRAFGEITPQRIAADLARYTGTQPVDDHGTYIRSRHIFHADNALGVQALVRDLQAVGDGSFAVRVHPFRHEGRALDNVEAELPGELDELVLVTAHLDSTAASSAGYDPVRDPAPGADDDASGTVGVLAIARAMAALSRIKRPKRTIRFVLFNAEEHGLVGSKAYARDQAALAAPIVAVFQTDMIGYNREAPRTFELHAGFLPSADIQERSRVLAQRIVRAAQQVSPDLPAAQIYLSHGPQQPDPADGRSDHSSFQRVGYPACAATEDFFAGPQPGSGEAEPNPNYHTTADTFVDVDYAADIVRAMGAAAWVTANL